VKSLGDSFLAVFDGSARAIRCASGITEAVRPLGIDVRTGLHTREVEMGEDDVRGIAVHIAARIAMLAGPGEVLVSRTVRDLVAGPGIRFIERGRHSLHDLHETMELYGGVT
jgi:class 3 adenylate cyclase